MPKHQVTTWFHQSNDRICIEEKEVAAEKFWNIPETRTLTSRGLQQLSELIGEILVSQGIAQHNPGLIPVNTIAPTQAPQDNYVPQRPPSPHAKIMEE